MRLILTETNLLVFEILAAASVLGATLASIHVLLRRGDNRSAIGWLGVFWLGYPLIGSLIYLLVGVNSIHRDKRAVGQNILSKATRRRPRRQRSGVETRHSPQIQPHMQILKRMGDRILGHSLHRGDTIERLIGGDEIYPAMLASIESATRSIAMASYIFKDDPAGQLFADALERAQQRGVHVRVLIDFMGSSHGGRSVYKLLSRRGVPVRRFMPTFGLPFLRFANLRNHRKLLVVDGKIGYTGGMNIDVAFWPAIRPADVTPKEDAHFRVQGPVVADLLAAFEQDWRFTTGEELNGEAWRLATTIEGPMYARGIADGPDSDTRLTHGMILAALATAKHHVKIATPYFLPPSDIMSALGVAALRGVKIELLVPDPTNSLLVQWASDDYLRKASELGCTVWADGGDFNHTKIMVVDDCWSLVGSSNWDLRSLRLNFEFNLECHHENLARQLNEYWAEQMKTARPWKHPARGERPLWVELRNGIARLFVPML